MPMGHKVDDKTRAKIIRWRRKGLTGREISEKLHSLITPSSVWYHLAKAGIDHSGNQGRRPTMNGISRPRIKPIVLGAEAVADVDSQRMAGAIDLLWSRLTPEEKLRAIEALKE